MRLCSATLFDIYLLVYLNTCVYDHAPLIQSLSISMERRLHGAAKQPALSTIHITLPNYPLGNINKFKNLDLLVLPASGEKMLCCCVRNNFNLGEGVLHEWSLN